MSLEAISAAERADGLPWVDLGVGKLFLSKGVAFLSSRAGQACIFWRRGCIFDAFFGEGVVFLTSQAGQVYIFDEWVALSTSSSANMRQVQRPADAATNPERRMLN